MHTDSVGTVFVGASKTPLFILFSELGFCMVSCSSVGFVDFTKLSFTWPNGKYFRICLCNTKPAQSLRKMFLRRNSRKKNRSNSKMAPPEASVHPLRNRLCYHFSLYQMNESCSQSVSRRLMLLRSFDKSCLRVTAPNATGAERPFHERSHMVLHVTRRLLL